jgi:dipeptidyl aminopeptidase/acylaminoacyl peptidase
MRVYQHRLLLILLSSLLCRVAIPDAITAQEAKALAVEDALRTKEFGPLMPIALSPDGRQLAYTVQDNGRPRPFDLGPYDRTGVPPWALGTDIWIQDMESGTVRNLSGGQGGNWLPAWSPDGHYLAFLSTRDGSQQARLWVWDVARDALKKVTDANMRGNKIEWMRDSQHVLITILPDGRLPEEYLRAISSDMDTEERAESDKNGPTAVLYLSDSANSVKAYSGSGPFNLDRNRRDLVSVDIVDGKSSTIVHGTRIVTFLLSPDGSRIAYSIPKRFAKPGSQQILFDLSTVEIAGDQPRIIASDIPLDFNGDRFSWAPDSLRISYRESGPGMVGDCYVVAINGNAPENVTKLSRVAEEVPSGSAEPLWEVQGKSVFFIHRGALWQAVVAGKRAAKVAEIPHREIEAMIPQSENLLWTLGDPHSTVVVTHDAAGKQDGFYKIDLRNGESTRLLENGQCYTCTRASHKFTVTEDGGRLLYFREDAQHDSDLWTSDAGFVSARRLTDLNPQFDKYRMGSARLIDWLSDDGQPLRGTLLLPSDYQEGVRYPLIVWVYGGLLLSNDFDHFGLAAPGPFNMQLLATRGYAILLPDMPLGAGTQMLDMAKTVLPGVSKVIELGVADPCRLGIMGHSFGGYSTLSLIVQTNRFRAAIEASGLGDLVGGYGAMRQDGTAFGISIEEQGPGSMGGTPWEVRDRYIANSPVYYFDRIKTPLLMLQGTEDPAVAVFLGDEVFVDLRRLGKEVEYVRYVGEGHSPLTWKYANQMDFCNRVIAWFDVHLKAPAKN